jgi:hypothetical protein
MKRCLVAMVAGALLAIGGRSLAHHSFAAT